MRKTLTSTFLLAASLMCSTLTVAQRPYIPEQPINSTYTQNQNQRGDSVLTELRSLLGDNTAKDSQSSSTANYSSSPTTPTQSSNGNQPNVVVYPKIRATVGSEIVVEPAQAIYNTPNQWTQSQQGQGQGQNQNLPIGTGNADSNGYTMGNGNTNGNINVNSNGTFGTPGNANTLYPYNAQTPQKPKVSELYTIVDGDTVSVVLPQKNFGRFDRGLYNYLYIPKGRWAFGLTASYGEFNTEDVELLNILKDFDVKGKLYSIKPFVTYFFRNNQSMGMRLNYTRGEADLSSMVFDFDDDMSFDLKDVSFYYEGYSMSVFYRNYVGLARNSRFSVFNDVDLSFSSGSSRFKRYYDQVTRDTQTTSMGVALNFSPGVCVFIMDNAAFNVSFGVFGVSMHKDKQITDGVEEGSRFSSGANFKFNLFNINFGLMIVI